MDGFRKFIFILLLASSLSLSKKSCKKPKGKNGDTICKDSVEFECQHQGKERKWISTKNSCSDIENIKNTTSVCLMDNADCRFMEDNSTNVIKVVNAESAKDCDMMCKENSDMDCEYWTFSKLSDSCYLLTSCDQETSKQFTKSKISAKSGCLGETEIKNYDNRWVIFRGCCRRTCQNTCWQWGFLRWRKYYCGIYGCCKGDCVAGQGDCNKDSDCADNYFCNYNVGPTFGFTGFFARGIDVCLSTPNVRLFEGNKATQDIVCDINFDQRSLINFVHDKLSCENDEARSLKIYRALAGEYFVIYDDPNMKPFNDDELHIEILKDINEPIIVPSFEFEYYEKLIGDGDQMNRVNEEELNWAYKGFQNGRKALQYEQEGEAVLKLGRVAKNGLDGKVSAMKKYVHKRIYSNEYPRGSYDGIYYPPGI